MIRLIFSSEPTWLDLFDDIRVKVWPFTSGLFARARDNMDDIAPAGANTKQRYVLLAIELAKLAIIEWQGVLDQQDQVAAVTPETISAMMDFWAVHEAFSQKYLTPGLLMGAEKKGSAPLPTGTSSPAGARNIAANAKRAARTASTKPKRPKPTRG